MSCLSNEQMRRLQDAISGYCGPAPDAVKVHTISHSVERYCRDIGGIRTHLGPVKMDHDNGIYFAVAPFGSVVFDIKNVSVNGESVRHDLFKVFFRDDGRASITFPFGKRENDFLELDILWRPGERTEQMPAQWFNKHFDTLMHGAIAAVLSQVGTAWGNPQLAKQFDEEYSRSVHDSIRELRVADSPNGQLSSLDPTLRWI